MTQYNNFQAELSNSQLSKLKSETKSFSLLNFFLSLSSNIIGNSNDETNFSYKF